jgi:sec-independent protein translocase protein TatA
MGFFQNLTGWHALILLAIVLLLFGAAKLPALARSMGQSMSIFRSEIKDRDSAAAASAQEADTGVDRDHDTAAAKPLTVPVTTLHPAAREGVPLTERSASS